MYSKLLLLSLTAAILFGCANETGHPSQPDEQTVSYNDFSNLKVGMEWKYEYWEQLYNGLEDNHLEPSYDAPITFTGDTLTLRVISIVESTIVFRQDWSTRIATETEYHTAFDTIVQKSGVLSLKSNFMSPYTPIFAFLHHSYPRGGLYIDTIPDTSIVVTLDSSLEVPGYWDDFLIAKADTVQTPRLTVINPTVHISHPFMVEPGYLALYADGLGIASVIKYGGVRRQFRSGYDLVMKD